MNDRIESETTQRLLRQRAVLARFGSYAHHEASLHKILTEAARLCAQGLSVQYCKVLKYRHTENDLLVEAGVGWKESIVGRSIAKADPSTPEGRAFVTGQPVITENLRIAHDFELPSIYAEHDIISSVHVVIAGNGQPYGILATGSDEPRDFDQYDVDFLTGYANVIAAAAAVARRLETLRATVEERDLLSRELEHRVRNNLQFVYELLQRQIRELGQEDAKRKVDAVARRVLTLALVYDHLLGVGLSRSIDFGEYLRTLCANVSEFEQDEHQGVELACNTHPMRMDLDQATALGIITNELLTNSYEHAFPDNRGRIDVILRREDRDHQATLIIADDGVGLEVDRHGQRLGIGLVRGLVEQIRGTLEFRSDRGTRWLIRFPVDTSEASEADDAGQVDHRKTPARGRNP